MRTLDRAGAVRPGIRAEETIMYPLPHRYTLDELRVLRGDDPHAYLVAEHRGRHRARGRDRRRRAHRNRRRDQESLDVPAGARGSRAGAVALAVAGLLFVTYPALRPWTDETTLEGATSAMTSTAWVVAHLAAMIGLVLVPLGVASLWALARPTPAEPVAGVALLVTSLGVCLMLPYFGAETFGLHAVATVDGGQEVLLRVIDGFRFQPVAIGVFGLGLVALAVGSVLVATAIRRSGCIRPAAGVTFALGFALFLPQFFAPAPVRIGHGVLVAVGCVWMALALWQAAEPAP